MLVENMVQAMARDILAEMILEAEDRVGHVVLHVHDEIVVEVPKDNAEIAARNLHKIMTTTPQWAPGLPLAASCNIQPFFSK